MRQTAAHRPYVGSAAVLSHHDLSPASRSRGRRPGFTLIEVTVALAILMIAVIALLASYGSYYRLSSSARITTTGQNFAQLVMEDIRSKSKDELKELCGVGYVSSDTNYPPNTATASDGFTYDSGSQPGTFTIEHVQSVLRQIPTASTSTPFGLVLPAGTVDVQPTYWTPSGNPPYWDWTVVFNSGVFPHYTKHVVIRDETPGILTAINKTYRIDVTITWTFGSSSKSTTVSSEK